MRTCSAWLASSVFVVLFIAFRILWGILYAICVSSGGETFRVSATLLAERISGASLCFKASLRFDASAMFQCLKVLTELLLSLMRVPLGTFVAFGVIRTLIHVTTIGSISLVSLCVLMPGI